MYDNDVLSLEHFILTSGENRRFTQQRLHKFVTCLKTKANLSQKLTIPEEMNKKL